MTNYEGFKAQLIRAKVPVRLAEQAADKLARQETGELPSPLEGEDLHIVNSAHAWMIANGNRALREGNK
jgi:hypothetical protein